MHFDLIQSLSIAGKTSVPNDDRIGCGERHAWVIDGATDLGPPGLMGPQGGAAWLAATAHKAFTGAGGTIENICAAVFDQVAAAYERERRRDPVARWEVPRAAFAAIAIDEDGLGCACIADCVILHRSAQGVAFLTPEPDRHIEQAEAAALGPGAGASGVSSPEVLADRRASRDRANVALGIDAEQIKAHTHYARAKLTPGDDLFLLSDGYAALIDTYHRYDAARLVARIQEHGLVPLAEELRRIEEEDDGCLRYPRFKPSDDASALWIRVG
ncbi:protein phosphatase 2C domain-containing protein [Bordetella sp. N]|uniref:protein phosphatase 2C domain-containing protein n=1 Tax=Bordetella sp. N TaxID=1746199 RepID=UPI00070BF965|nr:protein phosphatase 2C domain-containing protein [Bordetella sp. N]ALM84915.1 hypothetical protein ASB57_19785 [Bordetella sp. N]